VGIAVAEGANMSDCQCAKDGDRSRFWRECDYCGYGHAGAHCPHDSYQDPCPHCDVAPVVQLIAADARG
jgi:hypothetical protein